MVSKLPIIWKQTVLVGSVNLTIGPRSPGVEPAGVCGPLGEIVQIVVLENRIHASSDDADLRGMINLVGRDDVTAASPSHTCRNIMSVGVLYSCVYNSRPLMTMHD